MAKFLFVYRGGDEGFAFAEDIPSRVDELVSM